MGHRIWERTTRAPLTMLNGLTKAVAQVEDAKKHGGQILLGGNRVTGSGDYLFKAHDYQA